MLYKFDNSILKTMDIIHTLKKSDEKKQLFLSGSHTLKGKNTDEISVTTAEKNVQLCSEETQ